MSFRMKIFTFKLNLFNLDDLMRIFLLLTLEKMLFFVAHMNM